MNIYHFFIRIPTQKNSDCEATAKQRFVFTQTCRIYNATERNYLDTHTIKGRSQIHSYTKFMIGAQCDDYQ
jgi:hypothetical protein